MFHNYFIVQNLISLAGILTWIIILLNMSTVAGHDPVDYYHKPNYSFGYGVNDHYTNDIKSAQETRHGGWTKGSYSVLQPDGVLETVNYVADPVLGYRATVHNKAWSQHDGDNVQHRLHSSRVRRWLKPKWGKKWYKG